MIEFTHLNATADEEQRAPGFGESSTTTERFLMDKIKELEAQLPKVVVPTEHDRKRGTAYCTCEEMIAEWYKYCPDCGAHLDWTEVEK